jgi:hypothetical protein
MAEKTGMSMQFCAFKKIRRIAQLRAWNSSTRSWRGARRVHHDAKLERCKASAPQSRAARCPRRPCVYRSGTPWALATGEKIGLRSIDRWTSRSPLCTQSLISSVEMTGQDCQGRRWHRNGQFLLCYNTRNLFHNFHFRSANPLPSGLQPWHRCSRLHLPGCDGKLQRARDRCAPGRHGGISSSIALRAGMEASRCDKKIRTDTKTTRAQSLP